MIITYGFFVLFTFFIFIVNFLLIMRAWIIHKEDKFVNEETPKISILVPAYNEAVGIVDSINSLLNQDYKNYEIIVVDDGSTDDTYGVLKDCFIGNKKIQIYTKPNSGKSETLNFAATKAKGKYFMCIDADTILVPHAIRTMIGKKKPGVDAVSAMVGIHNEYIMKNGIPEKTSVPKSLSTRMQWMEYCRSYVVFRCSMKDKNVITVISGACGLISREIFDKCGGYKKEQLGEDMELTLNIHTNDGVIQFIPETLAWTEAPTNIKDLGTQRVRWFRGALQAFLEHPGLMLGKNNFTFRWLLLPYIWISDVLGVWVEIAAWAMLTYIIVTHAFIDWYVFAIIWAAIMFAHYINSLLIMFFVKYKLEVNYTSMYRAVVMALFEGLTYHFLYLYWLIKAHLQQLFRTSKKWNKLDRVGLKK
jgi:cellulose synthase/poly-beta-1,6-N-acetylglucosamine synthase-like glycosyltransferase